MEAFRPAPLSSTPFQVVKVRGVSFDQLCWYSCCPTGTKTEAAVIAIAAAAWCVVHPDHKGFCWDLSPDDVNEMNLFSHAVPLAKRVMIFPHAGDT